MTSFSMSKSLQIVAVLLFIKSVTPEPKQFIVDTKTPIVIQSEGTDSNGGISDFFGYSLTNMENFGSGGSHQQHLPNPRNPQGPSSSHTLFIGAPKDTRLPNWGVVWACTFNNGGQLSCSLLTEISNKPNAVISSQCRNLQFAENQTDQWIGASLSASSSTLYAGAPRWKKNGYFNGCRDTVMAGAHYQTTTGSDVAQLAPLDIRHYYTYPSAQGQYNEYWTLYAEYGLASHVTAPHETLLVGAPASRNWIGMYVEHTSTGLYYFNWQGEMPGIEPQSYLGYALSSGKTPNGGYYIVAGAPRAKSLDGVVVITNPGASASAPIANLVGNQFGSYFGYSVATVDINGDYYDDILVGAPMQTNYKAQNSYNTGCVFGYNMSQIQIGNTHPSKMICMSTLTRGARFGAAIANLGDINFDRKEDFAVAAPYDDNGIGTVFIFYGSGSFSTLSDKPAQVIRGKQLNLPNLQGFGTTLSCNGLDVDANGTPDLAIGSFETGTVVVIRTRPVAKASVKVSFHDTSKKQIYKFLPSQEDLVVRLCVRFQFSITLIKDNKLDSWLKFDVDPVHNRFEFEDKDPPTVQEDLSSRGEKCVDRHLKLKKTLSQEDRDSQPDIQFHGTVWYNYTEPLESTRIQHAAITLSSYQRQQQDITGDSSYEKAFRSFNPYLPAPIPETSNRISLAIANDNCKSRESCDPELKLESKIFVDGSETPYSGKEPLIIGKFDTLKFAMKVSNSKETAYSPVFRVTIKFSEDFKVPIDLLSFKWEEHPKLGQCNAFGSTGNNELVQWLRCSRPLQTGKDVTSFATLKSLKRIRVKDSLNGKLTVLVEAFPEAQMAKKTVKKDHVLPLEAKIEIDIDPTYVTGLAAVDPRSSDVVDLTQVYKLTNTKESGTDLSVVTAEILIPVQLLVEGRSKQVLGVVNPSNIVNELQCNSENFEFFDPVKLLRGENSTQKASGDSDTIRSRSTRSAKGDKATSSKQSSADKKDIPPEKSALPQISGNIIKMSGCSKMSPDCQKIICKTDFESKEVKEIRLQMYLLKDIKKIIFDDTTGIEVESSIAVEYPSKKVAREKGIAHRDFTRVNSIPALYYILAVGGGLLLLMLVSFCLYKGGFFRRKKKEELQQLKRQTQMIEGDMQMLETDVGDPSNPNAYQ